MEGILDIGIVGSPQFGDEVELQKRKKKKIFWIVLSVVIAILCGVGFWIYYSKYAKGYLTINSTIDDVDIQIINASNEQQYDYILKKGINKFTFEKGDYYYITLKIDYLSSQNYFSIDKLKNTKIDFGMAKIVATLGDENSMGEFIYTKKIGDNLYYLDTYVGKIFKTNLADNKSEVYADISELVNNLDEISKIIYSPDNNIAIVQTTDIDQNMKTYVYHTDIKSSDILSDKISDIDILNKDKIVYFYENDDGTKNLTTAQIDGSDWQSIEQLLAENVILKTVDNSTVSYFNMTQDKKILMIENLVDKTKKEIVLDDKLLPLISDWEKGKNIVYSIDSDQKVKVYQVDSSGNKKEIIQDKIGESVFWVDENNFAIVSNESGNHDQSKLVQYSITDGNEKLISDSILELSKTIDLFIYNGHYYFITDNLLCEIK